MRRLFIIALVFTTFVFPSTLPAAVSDGTRIDRGLLRTLATWVEHATGVKMGVLPMAVASGRVLKTSIGLSGIQQARSMAAYMPGQIVINNIIWDPESIKSQSYIVHELVHHAQLLGGKSYPCNNAKEKEAYLIQNRWLAEHGEDALFSDDWIGRMASCR